MDDLSHAELGELAFNLYVAAVGGKDVRGKEIPQWPALSEVVQQAWIAAAIGVMAKVKSGEE